jgi:hypothetical protein
MSAIIIIEQPNVTIQASEEVTVVMDSSNVASIVLDTGGVVPLLADVSLTAGANLSALRAVTSDANGDAVYASNDTLANAQVIGITETAASSGAAVAIRTSGLMSDANWAWTKGTIYLGTNGQLTQTAPSGGAFVVHVARALTATTIQIDIDSLIETA